MADWRRMSCSNVSAHDCVYAKHRFAAVLVYRMVHPLVTVNQGVCGKRSMLETSISTKIFTTLSWAFLRKTLTIISLWWNSCLHFPFCHLFLVLSRFLNSQSLSDAPKKLRKKKISPKWWWRARGHPKAPYVDRRGVITSLSRNSQTT